LKRVELIFGTLCARAKNDFYPCCNSIHQKTWPHCSACVKNNLVPQDLLPSKLENMFFKRSKTNKLLTKHVHKVSHKKVETKLDKNSKHENPYGSLQNGDFSRRNSLPPTKA